MEKSFQLGIRIDRKNFDEIGRAYRNTQVSKLVAEQNALRPSRINTEQKGRPSSRIVTDLSDVDPELLAKILNSRN